MLAETTTSIGAGIGGGGAVATIWGIVELVRRLRNGNGSSKVERPGTAAMCIDHERRLAVGDERFKHVLESLESLKSLHEKVDKLK